MKSDITWDSTGGLVTCGFFFRSEANFTEGKQYLFSMQRLSGLPNWRIAYKRFGEFQRNITGWRPASAIDQGQGTTNRLILIAQENHFTLYANGRKLGTFYDHGDYQKEGVFAFSAGHDSGLTTCTYEHTWVWFLQADD